MSSKPFTAVGAGWVLAWTPGPPYLDGSDAVVSAMLDLLDGQDLAVTPTGPWTLARPEDPLAVLALLPRVAPSVPYSVHGDPPEVPALPEGAVG